MQNLISLSTDLGAGNKGIGVMKAAILEIFPEATIIDLEHDNAPCDILQGARNFEAVAWLPKGTHVCVIDPGVGTARKGIIIETGRGDFLVGPDNCVLIPATRFLNGIKKVVHISNEKFFKNPVSPVFHGRDVFAPCTAHLSKGIAIEEFGEELNEKQLVGAPFEEAIAKNNEISAEAIHINRFGNVFLNIMQKEMHKLFSEGEKIQLIVKNKKIVLPYKKTFGEVALKKEAIMDDDFGRVEIATNQGNFAKKYSIKQGEKIVLRKR